jgi:hypothetical protein
MKHHMHLYSITFSDERYWKVIASGGLSRSSAWLANQEILGLLDETRDVRVLIDLRAVRGRPDMVTSILQAEMLATHPHMHTHRIAVIDLEQNTPWMHDEMLCLSNRGLPVQFFTAEAEALRWMLA